MLVPQCPGARVRDRSGTMDGDTQALAPVLSRLMSTATASYGVYASRRPDTWARR